MKSVNHNRTTAAPFINVTPLIDVLLVLLIIFMIISPTRPNKFDAKIPESSKDPKRDEQNCAGRDNQSRWRLCVELAAREHP